MELSSHLFLFIFFPLIFFGYLLIKPKYKKIYLFIISCIFVISYSIQDFLILFILELINFFLLKKVYKKKFILLTGIILNLLVLSVKYLSFILTNINLVLKIQIPIVNIIIPIGLSFIIFQNISCLIDLYKKKYKIKLLDFLLYSFYFPRILNGPILRINDFKKQVKSLKNQSIDNVFSGIKRFSFGLGKVCVLSYIMGNIWNNIYLNIHYISNPIVFWIGIICYSLYLYLNFSGFIDISIGISKLFGIELSENFNYPYMSKSISEFWRRWHITLSNWFRDYIYIPLGGNRKHLYLNIMIVFLLTGIWHGSSWNFIIWGLYLGILNIIDKFCMNKKFYNKIPSFIRIIFTDLFIMLGWVMFACSGMVISIDYYKAMIGLNSINHIQYTLVYFINKYNIIFLIISILVSLGIFKNIRNKITTNYFEVFEGVLAILVLCISILFIVNNTYMPSLYANF